MSDCIHDLLVEETANQDGWLITCRLCKIPFSVQGAIDYQQERAETAEKNLRDANRGAETNAQALRISCERNVALQADVARLKGSHELYVGAARNNLSKEHDEVEAQKRNATEFANQFIWTLTALSSMIRVAVGPGLTEDDKDDLTRQSKVVREAALKFLKENQEKFKALGIDLSRDPFQ